MDTDTSKIVQPVKEVSDEVKDMFSTLDGGATLKQLLEDRFDVNSFKDDGFKNWINTLSDTEKKTLTADDALKAYQTSLASASSEAAQGAGKLSGLASGLKSLGGTLLSGLANFGLSLAISTAISLAYKGIDYLVHYEDNLIKKGEEAKESITKTFDEFSSKKSAVTDLGKQFADSSEDITKTGDAIDVIGKKYTDFKQSIDRNTNKNLGLSESDYQSYLDMSNQLAEQFPTLVSGYDAQGNAMLNLGSNAEIATAKLKELYDAQMLSANVEIGEQLNDNYVGVMTQIKQYKDENKKLQDQIDVKEAKLDDLSGSIKKNNRLEFDTNTADGKKLKESVQKLITDAGLSYSEDSNDGNTFTMYINGEVSTDLANKIQTEYKKYGTEATNAIAIDKNELEKQVHANELLIKDQLKSITESISQYMQTSETFTGLNSKLQDAFLGNISNLNVDSIADDYDGDVQKFLYNEFLSPMESLKPKAQEQIADLLSLDPKNLKISEYKDLIDKTLKGIFSDKSDRTKFSKALGLDSLVDDATQNLNTLKERVSGFSTDLLDNLSIDEIQNGLDITANDNFSGTFDEFKKQIDDARALAATAIDINANPQFDAIAAADETKNAGDDYVKAIQYAKEAKEMYDKGLTGTDDFKTRAAYYSPTGADDAVNFAENYSKIKRYMTEDSTGVQNFLDDLKSKGYATFETLSDGTQKWSYDIEDLQSAATDMSMGFEWFMDMFGRLEDYDFHNNFVGSVEDGAERISDLSTQLVDAQTELERLKASGADSTAIEQQEAKVAQLKNDIEETQKATDQLKEHAAEQYAKQIATAKTEIESLNKQRNSISDDDYGGNGKEIKKMLGDKIKELAEQNNIELDADLNVVNADETVKELEGKTVTIPVEYEEVDYSDISGVKKKAQDALDETGGKLVTKNAQISIDLDSTDFGGIDNQLQSVTDALTYMRKNSKGILDIDTTEAQSALNVLNALYAQKRQLVDDKFGSMDLSGMDKSLSSAIGKLQEFQQTKIELERQNNLKQVGVEIDTSETEAAYSKLFEEIQNLDPEIQAKLGIDTTSEDSVEQWIENFNPEITAQLNIDKTKAENELKGIAYSDENEIIMKVDADTTQIQNALDKLKEGQSAIFNGTATDKNGNTHDSQLITGTRDVDGTIHYYAEFEDGKKVELEANKDGTYTYKADTSQADSEVEESKEKAESGETDITVGADTSKANSEIDKTKSSVESQNLSVGLSANPKDAYGVIDKIKSENPTVAFNLTADATEANALITKVSQQQISDIVVNVVGEDHASEVIDVWNTLSPEPKFAELSANDQASVAVELWNGLNADPKFTELSAEDQATTVVNLWNALNADPKSSELSAEDKATAMVNTYNSLRLQNKTSLLTQKGGEKATGVANSMAGAINSIPSSKSSTITITTIKETINKVTNKVKSVFGFADGTAHLSGTAHAGGTAFASGDWSVKKSETALVGELGTETLVRNGKYYTIGDNGAEFTKVRKGDIIFNHKQTEELFKNGHVTSNGGRARLIGESYATGTAYAGTGGGGGAFQGGASKSSSKKKKSSSSKSSSGNSGSSSGSSSKSSSGNSNSDSSSASDTSEKVIDWIETLLSRVKRITDLAVDSIDRAVGLINKQTKAADAISKVQAEIGANQEAAQAYLDKANSIDLSDVYKRKIMEGELTVESVNDETLQKNIEDYKSYYESYLSAMDNVLELEDKLTELAEKRLSIIEDQYDAIGDLKEAIKSGQEENRTLLENLGTSINSDANKNSIKQSITTQSQLYSSLTKKLEEYEAEVASQLKSGLMKKGSEQWYNAQKNIQEFATNITKASSELIELQDALHQIQYDVFQYSIDGFERKSNKMSAYIDLLDAQDRKVPESLYQQQIKLNNNQIAKQYNLRAKYKKEQDKYDVNSKRYQELAEKINDADVEILNLRKDNESLKDSIYELRFANIDKAIQKYSDLEDELSNFRDLLNDDAFVDKKGAITDEGLANIALLSQSLGNAKQKIADYTTGLTKLYQTYKNGVISADEYNEKAQEYRQGIQEATKDVKSYQDSLKDLYLKSMQTEVDYLGKIIDKRKEAMQAQKTAYEYSKKINSQSKDINSLKAQYEAIKNSNNLADKARAKQLAAQIKEKEEELSDTKRDHAQDMQEQGYDKMSSDLSDMLDSVTDELNTNADKQLEVINSMLDKAVSSYQEAYNKINSIIRETGFNGSADFRNEQKELSSQQGAQNQKNEASKSQSSTNKKPSSAASGTKTDAINDGKRQNDKITQEILKPEDSKRKVAELTVDKTSVTLEEGKSIGVKTSVRPNDAANKTLKWTSSNSSIATASNGTIKAHKPGSCTITVSTTDGGGISKTIGVTVTKKPEPVKPVEKPSSSDRDGKIYVGKKVTFTGRYYSDSWGMNPIGSLYSGVENGVIVDSYTSKDYGGNGQNTGDYKIHIKSADGEYGNLGWVRLDQLSGYKDGIERVPYDQVAEINEGNKDETVVTPQGHTLKLLTRNSSVLKNDAQKNLFDIANNPQLFAKNLITENLVSSMPQGFGGVVNDVKLPDVTTNNQEIKIENHYDQLLRVDNVDKNALPELKEILKQSYEYTRKEMTKDFEKLGHKVKR